MCDHALCRPAAELETLIEMDNMDHLSSAFTVGSVYYQHLLKRRSWNTIANARALRAYQHYIDNNI
jgi:hypothetical protein